MSGSATPRPATRFLRYGTPCSGAPLAEGRRDLELNARRLIVLLLMVLLAAACGPGGGPAARGARKDKPASFRIPQVDVELERGTDPRELVRIGTRGVAIGAVKEPLEWKLFPDPRRADDAWYLLRTYAPFRETTAEGTLVFNGNGKLKPDAAERRMIREWTLQVASEAAGGKAGEAYGLALSWRQGGSSGICSDVAVFLTGGVTATSCGWPGESRGRLEPAALGRLYGWFDRLRPFQAGSETQEGPNPRAALDTRLIFASRGTRPPSPSEQQEILAFAAELFSELAARKGAAPPPPAPEAPTSAPKPVAPTEPPAARLLLPKSAMSPRMEEAPLQFPEKPPAAPPPAPRAVPPA